MAPILNERLEKAPLDTILLPGSRTTKLEIRPKPSFESQPLPTRYAAGELERIVGWMNASCSISG